MKRLKPFLLWFLAVLLTLASVVYQRMTGPTYPLRGKVEIGGEQIGYKLLRTHETTENALIHIAVPDTQITAIYKWRRYKSHDAWFVETLSSSQGMIKFVIPKQPAAGKVMYHITLIDKQGAHYKLNEEPVIIRFKGPVPDYVLLPHILFMFLAMLIGTRTGLEALFKGTKSQRYAILTAVFLFIGGLILGPIVQKFAFNAYWTGWPIGHDLTDNKTALAFIFWIVAIWRGAKSPKSGRVWYIVAAIVQLLVYLVPHSVLGSEIDYTTMDK